jgi:hypothetical protein
VYPFLDRPPCPLLAKLTVFSQPEISIRALFPNHTHTYTHKQVNNLPTHERRRIQFSQKASDDIPCFAHCAKPTKSKSQDLKTLIPINKTGKQKTNPRPRKNSKPHVTLKQTKTRSRMQPCRHRNIFVIMSNRIQSAIE